MLVVRVPNSLIGPGLLKLDLLAIGAIERMALAACVLAFLWLGAAWALA